MCDNEDDNRRTYVDDFKGTLCRFREDIKTANLNIYNLSTNSDTFISSVTEHTSCSQRKTGFASQKGGRVRHRYTK